MVARHHPPVVFGAAAIRKPDTEKIIDDADQARLKARAARFHTDFKPAVAAKAPNPVIGADFDLLTQEEAEKRRQRAQKFGTPLVQNGLQPALTSKQAAKPKEVQQHAVGPSEAAPASAEMTDAELADQAEQRRKTASTAERRPDTVHLHGVHFMTTSDCLHFFADFGPSSVEWINDASCNVVFPNADSASKAILGLGTVATPEEAPDGFGCTEADLGEAIHRWHKGTGYAKGEVDNFPVELLFRVATVADIKQGHQNGQGAGRGKKAHRGKGKGRRGQGQQKQPQKRLMIDLDGDLEMRHRGERGGKRYRRRNGLAAGVQDVEMHDVETFDDSEVHLTNGEVRQAAAHGDASFSRQAYGPGTMFSASAAGAAVAPSFQHYAPIPTQDFRDVQLVDYGDI